MAAAEPNPKRRRFEGFIHQKIDPNLLRAMTFLSKSWGVSLEEIATRAIQETATRAALEEEVSPSKLKHSRAKAKAATSQPNKDPEPEVRIVRDEALE